MNKRSRDHGRKPMQWSNAENAGFSETTPWFAVNPNYTEINVEESMADKDGIYGFYKKLISLRKREDTAEILREGTFTEYYPKNKDLFVYKRSYKGKSLFVVCNFKNKQTALKLPNDISFNNPELIIANYDDCEPISSRVLRPYEAFVFMYSE